MVHEFFFFSCLSRTYTDIDYLKLNYELDHIEPDGIFTSARDFGVIRHFYVMPTFRRLRTGYIIQEIFRHTNYKNLFYFLIDKVHMYLMVLNFLAKKIKGFKIMTSPFILLG